MRPPPTTIASWPSTPAAPRATQPPARRRRHRHRRRRRLLRIWSRREDRAWSSSRGQTIPPTKLDSSSNGQAAATGPSPSRLLARTPAARSPTTTPTLLATRATATRSSRTTRTAIRPCRTAAPPRRGRTRQYPAREGRGSRLRVRASGRHAPQSTLFFPIP